MIQAILKLSILASLLMFAQGSFAESKELTLAEDSWVGMSSLKDFLVQQNVAIEDCHSSTVLTIMSKTQEINKAPWLIIQDGNAVVTNKYDRILAKSKVFLIKELQKNSDAMGLSCNVSELAKSLSNLK